MKNTNENREPAAPWVEDAVLYSIDVMSFKDSDGDGKGDLRGLIGQLSYIEQLGVNTIVLLPVYPSMHRDQRLPEAEDFTEINPLAGNISDFEKLVQEAHFRSLRVISALCLSHASSQHPWFQRARRAPVDSAERSVFIWEYIETPPRREPAPFKDYDPTSFTWDPIAGALYRHRNPSRQPILNLCSHQVRESLLEVVDFWLSLGIDGLYLMDAPYLSTREPFRIADCGETTDFLQVLLDHVAEKYSGKVLLLNSDEMERDSVRLEPAVCSLSISDALASRIFMAIQMEDSAPLAEAFRRMRAQNYVGLFLRHHNELSLEGLTPDERDFMLATYVGEERGVLDGGIRRRLAPMLRNDRRLIELMFSLLFSLPVVPGIYYGDEIGMGDNVWLGERSGLRTPMQWSHDRNAGFSRCSPHLLLLPPHIDPEFHYESVNVENLQANPSSLLHWMQHRISVRNQVPVLRKGRFRAIGVDNSKVVGFVRELQGEPPFLVVANLSAFTQNVNLDLVDFVGLSPIEVVGKSEFPVIQESRYFLSLTGYACSWFVLKPAKEVTFHSCFISYSGKDSEFAERLYQDLTIRGVRCWYAPHHVRIGEKFRERIDGSIQKHDKLLVVLSVNSVESAWVEEEVESALEREQQEGQLKIFPVRIDRAVFDTSRAWAASLRRMRHIGNFEKWKDDAEYEQALAGLLRDLEAREESLS